MNSGSGRFVDVSSVVSFFAENDVSEFACVNAGTGKSSLYVIEYVTKSLVG